MQDLVTPLDDTRILRRDELDMPPLEDTEHMVLPASNSLPLVGV